MEFYQLRLKMSLDGRVAHLLKGAVRKVALTWSKKNKRFNVFFHDPDFMKLYSSDPRFKQKLEALIVYLEAYKIDADRLENSKRALESIYRE